jgi:2-methylisocitrate lyase-like PEP mutase family enzyme
MNVKRTVFGYARSGMAGIMIEDQIAPKRCGHVSGKSVLPFEESITKIQAACDARNEYEQLYGKGTGPLILARTDSLKIHGFHHAIERCLAYQEVGCDITFLEAPESIQQMKDYCTLVPGYKLANMLEYGTTPILSPKQLKEIGYTMAAYPLTLLSSSIKTIQESLHRIEHGTSTNDIILPFTETKDIVGFTEYFKNENRYKVD